MKKYIAIILLLCGTCLFAQEPQEELTVDYVTCYSDLVIEPTPSNGE